MYKLIQRVLTHTSILSGEVEETSSRHHYNYRLAVIIHFSARNQAEGYREITLHIRL